MASTEPATGAGAAPADQRIAIGPIVVALISPKYRVAVVLQVPATLVKDAATRHLALDLFMRGIVLP